MHSTAVHALDTLGQGALGPGQLARPSSKDQNEQPTGGRASKKPKQEERSAHVQGPQYTVQLSEQVNNLGNSTIPIGAGTCLLFQIPPDLHLPYLAWCLPFCFAWVQLPAFPLGSCLGSQLEAWGQKTAERYSMVQPLSVRHRLSTQQRHHHPPRPERRSTSHNLSNHLSHHHRQPASMAGWFWATDPRPHAWRQLAGISEAKQL